MYAFCRCEDGEDYYGTIEYDGDFGIKLNLDKSYYNYEDDYVRVVVDDPELLDNYKNITQVWGKIEMINSFRAGGPWIARKDMVDQATGCELRPETAEISTMTAPKPVMVSQEVNAAPQMTSQGCDATPKTE
jgi:hypothetical protein